MDDPAAPSLAALMEEMKQIREQNRNLLAHNAALRAQQGGPSTSAAQLTSTPFVPQSQSLAGVLNVSALASTSYDASGDASSSGGQLNAPPAYPSPKTQSSVVAAYEMALARDQQESLEVQRKLNQPLGPELVSSRPGPNGRPLHYLATHQALRLANDVFRHDQWSSEILEIHPEFRMRSEGVYDVYCWVRVQITLRNGAFRQDIGAHSLSNQRDLDSARENTMKSAVSDGIKRALKAFGDRLGLCLYDEKYRRFASNLSKVKMEYDASNIYRGDQFMASQKNPTAYGAGTLTNTSAASSSNDPVKNAPQARPAPDARSEASLKKPTSGSGPGPAAPNKVKTWDSTVQRNTSAHQSAAASGLPEGLEAQKAKAAREAQEKRYRYQKIKQEQEAMKESEMSEAKRKRAEEEQRQSKRVHSEPRATFRGPPVPTKQANPAFIEGDTIDTELAASQLASFFNDDIAEDLDLTQDDVPQSHTPTGMFREPAHRSPTSVLRMLPSDWADDPGWGQAQSLASYTATPSRSIMSRGKTSKRQFHVSKWRPITRKRELRGPIPKATVGSSSSSSIETLALALRSPVRSQATGVILRRRRY